MRTALSSELIKITSTRTFYGLLAGAVAVVALTTWSAIANIGAANVKGHLSDHQMFYLSAINLSVFAVIVGIRAITDEFRHGTVVPGVLVDAPRRRFLAAKAIVAATAAAVIAATAQLVMAVLATTLTSGSLIVDASDLRAMAGLTLSLAMWAAIGVGAGAVVRHQVAAIVGAIVWVLIIENLGAGLLGDAGRYLPGSAAHALAALPDQLSVPTAAAVLTTYAAAALTAGHLSNTRRDL